METTRNGNFSSSMIHLLMKRDKQGGFGAPALNYIREKRYELRLGRSINSDHSARSTTWGTFLENRAFELMPMNYKLESKERLAHPTIKHWTGAPDLNAEDVVCDIKCPYTLKSFCETVDSLVDVETFKSVRPDAYWQLVSNAILTGKDQAEIIVYCPYQSV